MYIWELFTNGGEGPSREGLLNVIAFIVALVVALVMHEFSHALVAKWFGDDTAQVSGRLSINPLKHIDPVGFILMLLVGFGWARPVPVNPTNFKKFRTGMFCVALAGIVMNLLIAFLFCGLYVVCIANFDALVNWNQYVGYFLWAFCSFMLSFNLSFAMFNLLPLYPLDGYRVLSCFIPQENGFMRFLRKYSLYILLGLLLIGYIPYVKYYSPLDLYMSFTTSGLSNLFLKFWVWVFAL